MTMNGAVLPIMAFYIVAAQQQGVDLKDLAGNYTKRYPQRIYGA